MQAPTMKQFRHPLLDRLMRDACVTVSETGKKSWWTDRAAIIGEVLTHFFALPQLSNATKDILSQEGSYDKSSHLYRFSSKFQDCMKAQDMMTRIESDDGDNEIPSDINDYICNQASRREGETGDALCLFAKEIGVESTITLMSELVKHMDRFPSGSEYFAGTDVLLYTSEGGLEWQKATCCFVASCFMRFVYRMSVKDICGSTEHEVFYQTYQSLVNDIVLV